MKFIGAFVFVTSIAAVIGAALPTSGDPTLQNSIDNQIQEYQKYQQYQQYLRDRRSSYPGAYYAPAPCASAHVPAYLPPAHHPAAYAPAALPHYGIGYPQYRDTDENEMMGFSDMDTMQEQAMSQQAMFEQMPPFGHNPMARYAYGPVPAGIHALAPAYGGASSAAAAAALAGINSAHAGAAGPAIGVFPNANVGGCSVPLLLSCSPSIRPGHIVKSHPYAYGGGEAYRGVDQPHEAHDEPAHDLLAPAHDSTPTSAPLHQ